MIKLVPIFTVRIVYKSGHTHDFECTKFSVNGGRYSWTSVSDHNKPVQIGAEDIAAVWQVGVRKKIAWSITE
jgi:hypothetical protein